MCIVGSASNMYAPLSGRAVVVMVIHRSKIAGPNAAHKLQQIVFIQCQAFYKAGKRKPESRPELQSPTQYIVLHHLK